MKNASNVRKVIEFGCPYYFYALGTIEIGTLRFRVIIFFILRGPFSGGGGGISDDWNMYVY